MISMISEDLKDGIFRVYKIDNTKFEYRYIFSRRNWRQF